MKTFIAIKSSNGRLMVVKATDRKEAYKIINQKVFGVVGNHNDDIDLYEIPESLADDDVRILNPR